eukprot:TRINITY_DN925_c0_g3_i1.p1 TRINITY_DN925_c0_g3~~TRINITY_DN925_c0_g3_i1.p1  ORF type:complete len:481 (+),score=104.80 TRINITY_DN925_c0_g3_i1:22-1443(+)
MDAKDRDEKNQSKILLGPVIGKTTSTSTRVLIEVNCDCQVTCVLTNPQTQQEHRVSSQLRADWPFAFAIDDLQPQTAYKVHFEGVWNGEERHGLVRTMSAQPQQLRVVAAACDKMGRRGPVDLMSKLYTNLVQPGLVDLIIRHGDQVYADPAFDQGVRILRDPTIPEHEKDHRILMCYKEIYRATWNVPSCQTLLANAPHLMLWDDHEVRNDWGTMAQDTNPASADWRIALQARKAYWQYQRQLWDDIANVDNRLKDPECHLHRWGAFGIILLDSRGCRSFAADPHDPPNRKFLGQHQHDIIRAALKPDGLLGDVRGLVVVMSMPPVYCNAALSSCMSCIPPLVDKMGFGLHNEEQGVFLDMLDEWKGKAGERQLLLLGGDLHYGMRSTISFQGRFIAQQMVSSAISNSPPPCCSYWFLRCFMACCCCCSYGGGHSVSHEEFINERNFAFIQLDAPAIGSATLQARFITAHTD